MAKRPPSLHFESAQTPDSVRHDGVGSGQVGVATLPGTVFEALVASMVLLAEEKSSLHFARFSIENGIQVQVHERC